MRDDDEKFKRFILFTWDAYYPSGGMGDFEADFDTLEEMLEYAKGVSADYQEGFDCKERLVIDTE